ncbi:Flp family type IVb pilin [Candidatus Gracilibacteria bacterium]|nr:Flp family type IVb pilin [Candidatus Gracilibacteria bacterium]
MKKYLQRFHSNCFGQALTEYALIVALLGVAVIAVVALLGDKIKDVFQAIADNLTI